MGGPRKHHWHDQQLIRVTDFKITTNGRPARLATSSGFIVRVRSEPSKLQNTAVAVAAWTGREGGPP